MYRQKNYKDVITGVVKTKIKENFSQMKQSYIKLNIKIIKHTELINATLLKIRIVLQIYDVYV